MNPNPYKPTNPKTLEAIAKHWKKNPFATQTELVEIFHVAPQTVRKVEREIWSVENPRPKKPYVFKPRKHGDKLGKLAKLLETNPDATIHEIANLVGASPAWVWRNSPLGTFQHKRGPRPGNSYWEKIKRYDAR